MNNLSSDVNLGGTPPDLWSWSYSFWSMAFISANVSGFTPNRRLNTTPFASYCFLFISLYFLSSLQFRNKSNKKTYVIVLKNLAFLESSK